MKMKLSFPLAVLIAATPFTSRAETVNFDHAKPGELPAEWAGGVTGSGQANWSVTADDTAPSQPHVFKQSGQGQFVWCVLKDVSFTNGSVQVRFKTMAGAEDRAGGVVWRFQDGDNYYVCRANALEDNVRLYRVVKGRRTQLHSADVKVAANQWHTLRVDFTGPLFKVLLNGLPLCTAVDRTFTNAGKVGVWTKADSVTEFDDFWFGR